MRAVKFLMRVFTGLVGIFAADVLLSPTGLCVGINLFTGLFTAILGVPGFIMLYVLAYLLK